MVKAPTTMLREKSQPPDECGVNHFGERKTLLHISLGEVRASFPVCGVLSNFQTVSGVCPRDEFRPGCYVIYYAKLHIA
jgi:hypothetical protein